jgi:5-methyltetrahydrofolate--homocysteine methyltransferase
LKNGDSLINRLNFGSSRGLFEVFPLTNEAVLERLKEAVVKFDVDAVKEACDDALQQKIPPYEIVTEGMAKGMEIIGEKYEKGEFFLSELIMAAETMKEGIKIIEPYLQAVGKSSKGQVVLGTVEGDLHDIGKNIVASLLRGSGFGVADLGANVPPRRFVEEAEISNAQIVGMSALLTTTMVKMADTMKALVEAGIRDRLKVILGGAPINSAYATKIGADAAANDAIDGVAICRKWAGVS